MDCAAREVPQQPAVDRPGTQLASLGTAVAIGDGIEQPADLAGGEQGVDRQAGPLFDERPQAAIAKRLAQRRRAATLPDDGRADRPGGRPFPHQHGLALVRHPDGIDMPARCVPQALLDGIFDTAPERDRVLLGPTRLGERDINPARGARHDVPAVVEEENLRVGRALIDREHVPFRHVG